MQYGEYKRSSGGNVEGNMADVFVGRKRNWRILGYFIIWEKI